MRVSRECSTLTPPPQLRLSGILLSDACTISSKGPDSRYLVNVMSTLDFIHFKRVDSR